MNMPTLSYRHYALAGVLIAVGLAMWIALREEPVAVDLDTAQTAPMSVTVDEEGVTRMRNVYALSAPIAGHLDRITLDPGDPVIANETVVATIHPLDPPFLDRRTEAELQAAAQAARSAIALAKVERERAEAGRDLARAEYRRASRLVMGESISESDVERRASELRVAEAALKSAMASIDLRRAELSSIEARLAQPSLDSDDATQNTCCIAIRSPVDGVVLTLVTRSEQVLAPGSPIAEIGDPSALEVVVDILSADAVRIKAGTPVAVSDWGGEEILNGQVRRIEPVAFETVSALGIEERRVKVIVDLEQVPDSLGHGYRVFAQLQVWHSDDTLQVPLGALFRSGGSWAVFVASDNRATRRLLDLGRMNDEYAEVLDGLTAGEQVVLHPSDRVADGVAIAARQIED